MPLKLIPPRAGKTPYWYVRGSYLGIAVDRSTRTTEKRLAGQILRRLKGEIERGEHQQPEPEPVAAPVERTFLAAAVAYMKAGGERTRLSPIVEMTGPNALRDRHIDEIDQIVLDTAAAELYPRANPATRNREFYTPVAAVLHHAGVQTRFKRPKGWRGNKATSWLEPEQAFALFAAADKLDPEFALFCRFLLYTGMRLDEALKVRLGHLDLKRQFLYLPETKNKQPRAVYLPPVLVAALAAQPPRPVRPTAEPGVRLPNGVAGRSQADAGVSFLERHNGGHPVPVPRRRPPTGAVGPSHGRSPAHLPPATTRLSPVLPYLRDLDAPLRQPGHVRANQDGEMGGSAIRRLVQTHRSE